MVLVAFIHIWYIMYLYMHVIYERFSIVKVKALTILTLTLRIQLKYLHQTLN